MEEILQFLQAKYPYLIPRLVTIDYLYKQNIIPVLILKIGDTVAAAPIIGDSIPALYLPNEDKFIPLVERVVKILETKSHDFEPTDQRNVPSPASVNIWQMIRPPVSARAVYASVKTEPTSVEFYQYGFVIEETAAPDKKPYRLQILKEGFSDVRQIKPGEKGNFILATGDVVQGLVLVDANEPEHCLIYLVGLGYVHPVPTEKLPLAREICPLDPETDFEAMASDEDGVVITDGCRYIAYETEDGIFRPIPQEGVRISSALREPFVSSDGQKAVVPAEGWYVFRIGQTKANVEFVYNPDTVEAFCLADTHSIKRLGGGEFLLDGEFLPSPADLARALAQLGLLKEDILLLVKTAQAEDEVRFALERLEESSVSVPDYHERKEEIVEAFDSQMRLLLSRYLEGKPTDSAEQTVNSLRNAFLSAIGEV